MSHTRLYSWWELKGPNELREQKVPPLSAVSVPAALRDLWDETAWWLGAVLSSQLYFVLDIAVLFTHLAICEVKINLFANLRLSEKLKNYTFSTH